MKSFQCYRLCFILTILTSNYVLVAQQSVYQLQLIKQSFQKNPDIITYKNFEAVLRSEIVLLNDVTQSNSFQLNLFDDIDMIVKKVRDEVHSFGSKVWIGQVQDQKWGYVLISTYNGTSWIKIEMDDGSKYLIIPQLSSDRYTLLEVDKSMESELECQDLLPEHFIEEEFIHNKSFEFTDDVCEEASNCNGQVVDLMVLYTSAAKNNLGGVNAATTAISMAVSEMNMINANSGVNHSFNLVYTEEVNYTTVDQSTDLSRLRNQSDGYLDHIHELREMYYADLVSMIVSSGTGVGYVNSNPTNFHASIAFSVLSDEYLVNHKTLAHEVGHNLGLRHDRYAYINGGGSIPSVACDWAFGIVNPNANGGTSDDRWRTIMAYPDQCNDWGFNCTRIPNWSNPDILYNGDPTGVSNDQIEPANSSFMLNRSFCKVSRFRDPPICTNCTLFQACSTYNENTDQGPGNITTISLSGDFYPINNAQDITICVTTNGDNMSSSEVFNILDENGINRGLTAYGNADCTIPNRTCFIVNAADYNGWIVNDIVSLNLDPANNSINPQYCQFYNDACVEILVPIQQDCPIINIIALTQSSCIPNNNTYSQDIQVTYSNPPGSGNLVVNGQNFSITSSPQTVTLNNLPADGNAVNVTASFSANLSCSVIVNNLFIAPSSCAICNLSNLTALTQSICDPNLNTYTQDIQVIFSNPPASGNLLVNSQSFPITSSPQTITLSNLTANGSSVNVNASFSANPSCNVTSNNLFTAPASCTPCSIINISALTQSSCDANTSTYSQDIQVTYSNPPGYGNLVINGQSFPITTSPQTVTLINLPADGNSVNVTVNFSVDNSCSLTYYNLFTAPSNCDACSITSLINLIQTACEPNSNTYSQDIQVTYSNPPLSGNLIVNGQNFSITTSPQTVTLTNLTADGNPVNVTASFTDEQACTKTENALFTAPAPCTPVCNISSLSSGIQSACEPNSNTYSHNIQVTYSNPPASGNLVVNGQSFSITTSPQTATLTNLTADGNSVNIIAYFSDEQACTKTENNLFTAPASCTPVCNISSLTSGIQSACEPNSNSYSQVIQVTYSNPPASGNLIVNGQSFSITTSPQTLTLTNLTANGNPVNVTAYFSDEQACTKTVNNLFTAPASCTPVCIITELIAGSQTACDPNSNFYSQDIQVTYSNPPATGNLVVNGQSFAISSSPQTVTLTNLIADGNPVNVTASFSEGSCGAKTESNLFTAPASCSGSICSIDQITALSQSTCDPIDNKYTQQIQIEYSNPPSGNIVLNGQYFAITNSPQIVMLTGLNSDGNPVNVMAYFDQEPNCSITVNNLFTAPASCLNSDCQNTLLTINSVLDSSTYNNALIIESAIQIDKTHVSFIAQDAINLQEGFEVLSEKVFSAEIDDCINHTIECDPNTSFSLNLENNLGGSNEEHTRHGLLPLADGGMMVSGWTWSNDYDVNNNHGERDMWIAKLKSDLSIDWEKTYGGSLYDRAREMVEMSDGGFFIVGGTHSSDGDIEGTSQGVDAWIVKIDAIGTLIWEENFGNGFTNEAQAVIASSDGNYIVAGHSWDLGDQVPVNNGNGRQDFWIFKMDENGNMLWSKFFGGTESDEAYDLIEGKNGEIIVAGYAMSNDNNINNHGAAGTLDFWVMKLNINGNLIWQETYGGSGDDYAWSIESSIDTGYVVLGYSDSVDGDVSNPRGNKDYWMIKISEDGSLIWEKSYGGSADEVGHTVIKDGSCGYMLIGQSNSDLDCKNNGGNDYWVIRTDEIGNEIWQDNYGGVMDDNGWDIVKNSNGSFTILGNSASSQPGGDVSNNNGDKDLWIVNIAPDGNNGTNECYQLAPLILTNENNSGGSYLEHARHGLIQTENNGVLICGLTQRVDGDIHSEDIQIVKFDANLNIVWEKNYGGTMHDRARDQIMTPDGGYLVAGTSYSNDGHVTNNRGKSDVWLFKLDAAGALLWEKNYGTSEIDEAHAIFPTSDGGYVISGDIRTTSDQVPNHYGSNDFWIFKIDAIGNLIWSKVYGGSADEEAYDLVEGLNGEIIVTGWTESNDNNIANHGINDTRDYWVIKLDAFGDLIWQNTYGGSAQDYPWSIETAIDTGYVIFGFSESTDGDVSHPQGNSDYWLIKISEDGSLIWDKSYGGNGDDQGHTVIQDGDCGYMLIGQSNSDLECNNNGGNDYWVIRTDENGNEKWSDNYGGALDDNGWDILKNPDGSFALMGNAASSKPGGDVSQNNGDKDFWVLNIYPDDTDQCTSFNGRCFESAYRAGGIENSDSGMGIAVNNNNVIITGTFGGTAHFGGTSVTAVGNDDTGPTDLYVAKFGQNGTLSWIRHAGGQRIPNEQTGTNRGEAVTIDLSDNVIFTGNYLGSPIFGSITLPAGGPTSDFFVAKYDFEGTLDWVRTGLGSSCVEGRGITTDNLGNIYATGMFGHNNSAGSANFDGTVLNSVGGRDIFIVKYDPTGTLQWAKRAGSSLTGNEIGENLVIDPSGNVLVVGWFQGTADFDTQTLISAGGRDLFVTKYMSNGDIIWSKRAGGLGSDAGNGIANDQLGNSYITGVFEGTAAFGSINLSSAGQGDIFVAKYDDAGNVLWAKRAGGVNHDNGSSIKVDLAGNSYITGSFTGAAQFGTTLIYSNGQQDIFVACYDTDGNLKWVKQAGGANMDEGSDIALDNSGNSFITGHFESSADFYCNNLISDGGKDIFYTKVSLCPGYTQPINMLLGGDNSDTAIDIQQTSDGGYITCGYSESSENGDVTDTNHGGRDIWVVKLNAEGIPEWNKLIGGNNHDSAPDIQQTSDGGYIVAGISLSTSNGDVSGTNHGSYDYWIVKLHASGSILWNKLIGGIGDEKIQGIQQTTDGGYIVGGYSDSSANGDVSGTNHGNQDYWIVKLNSFGTIEWDILIGGNNIDYVESIQQTTDGGYIVNGYSDSSNNGDVTGTNHGSFDYWIVKLDATGTIQWNKLLGGDDFEQSEYIQQTSDGGYIVVGASYSSANGDVTNTNHGNRDYWIVKLNASGIIQWERLIGGTGDDVATKVKQTVDGGYIVCGKSESSANGDVTGTNHGSADIWIVKLDGSGTIIWNNLLGGSAYDFTYNIEETSDGGYIMGAYTESSVSGDVTGTNHGSRDYWIVKLDELGNIQN